MSPIELVAQSGDNVIAASADDHSTLGGALLLGSDESGDEAAKGKTGKGRKGKGGTKDPTQSKSSSSTSVHQPVMVPKAPSYPPPHRDTSGSSEVSEDESFSEAPWKRQRRQ